MNCLHHIGHWLFPSGAAVAEWIAAAATTGLVIYGRIQLKAIRKGAEEQRARWKREDEIRSEEKKPKVVFRLKRDGKDEGQIGLWCANVGTVSFTVAKIVIEPLQGEQPPDIAIDEHNPSVILVGSEWQVDLGSKTFGRLNGNFGVCLSLYSPSGEVLTEEQAYHFRFNYGICMSLSQGLRSHHREPMGCPNCKTDVAYFRVDGMASVVECRREIAEVRREFEASCPNHASSNSRVTFGT